MERYNRPAKQPTTQQEKRLTNIEHVLQNPLKIDLKSIKKQAQIHLKGSLGPLWAPKGCHRNEGVFLGPLFIDFCSILETLWAPIFDPFDHLWAIGAPLDPSWEGSEKATVFLSLWEPPRTSQYGVRTINSISNSRSPKQFLSFLNHF